MCINLTNGARPQTQPNTNCPMPVEFVQLCYGISDLELHFEVYTCNFMSDIIVCLYAAINSKGTQSNQCCFDQTPCQLDLISELVLCTLICTM